MEKEEMENLIKGALAESRKIDRETNEPKDSSSQNKEIAETFNCPECNAEVTERQKFCNGCGVELEWGE